MQLAPVIDVLKIVDYTIFLQSHTLSRQPVVVDGCVTFFWITFLVLVPFERFLSVVYLKLARIIWRFFFTCFSEIIYFNLTA